MKIFFLIEIFYFSTVPGAPDEIKALVMSSDSILVVWTSPKEPAGKIIKYNIYMQNDEDVSENSFT